MQDNVCVITTVRDDEVMLRKFVTYYGALFGKDALYVINHGDQQMVRDVAAGCNLIPIPDNRGTGFEPRRWRTQNHLMNALRQWFTHIIVVDVDEFVVVDPACGHDLASYLAATRGKKVLSAFGLEVVHLVDREPDGIEPHILGPRRFAQINGWYSKPCIVSKPTRLSRGGHFATEAKLDAPEELYLLHMKFCDFGLYAQTLDRRGDAVKAQGVTDLDQTTTSKQWFGIGRDDDRTFEDFCARPIETNFDFSGPRQQMHETWAPRTNELFHFKRPGSESLFALPERFFGIV